MKGQLAQAFAELVKQVFCAAPHAVVSPAQLKRVVGKWAPHFSGYNQQDCQEFMRFLLDGLGEDLNRLRNVAKPEEAAPKKEGVSPTEAEQSDDMWQHYMKRNDSLVTEIFCGQLRSSVECTTCGHVSLCFDPFLDISLPIPKKAEVTERSKKTGAGGVQGTGQCTLDECLQAFTAEEILDNENKYTCDRCKKRRKCVKKLTIHRWPRVLVLHVKRFQYTAVYRDKLTTSIAFPFKGLDLRDYISETRHADADRCAVHMCGARVQGLREGRLIPITTKEADHVIGFHRCTQRLLA